jgi:hypothetical protein
MDFLEYTLETLRKNGKAPDDVMWVGAKDGTRVMTWVQFVFMARNVHLDYTIAYDLVVVGDDWWMERIDLYDRDGQEWLFCKQPKRQAITFAAHSILSKDYPWGSIGSDE